MARPKRVGKPLARGHEVALRRALWPMVRQAQATAAQVRTAAQARSLGVALRREWSNARIRELLASAGRTVETAASVPWRPLLARSDGARMDAAEYDGRALVETWSKDAAKLITSVRDEVAEAIRKDVVAALERGTDPAELAARWRSQGLPVSFGTLEGRVKVIANHQLSLLHAEVARKRAQALGITDFVWRSQGDSRVRPSHRSLDGTRHKYADPPSEGLPGQPVNCRCYAESIVPAEILPGRLSKAPEQRRRPRR